MKNFIMGVAVVVGSIFAGNVLAEGTALGVGGGVVTETDCVLLSSQVRINLSANVSGGYQCDEIDQDIRIATCHAAGSRQAGSEQCQQVGTETDGSPIFNDASCGSAADTFEIADFRGFVASSTGGSVSAQALGGACGTDTVTALGIFE